MSDSQWDAVVIGSGVAGLMAANALATRLSRVLLIEKDTRIGSGQSTLSAATVHARGGHADDRTIASSEIFPPMDFISEEALTEARDVVMVYAKDDARDVDLEKRGGVDVTHTLDSIFQPEFAARVRARRVAEIQLDPVKAVASATQAFLANGGTIATGVAVEDFIADNGEIVGLRTSSRSMRELKVDRIVITAGARTVDLALKAAARANEAEAGALQGFASRIVMRYSSHLVARAADWLPNIRCMNDPSSNDPINGPIAVENSSGNRFLSGPHTQPKAEPNTRFPDRATATRVLRQNIQEKLDVMKRCFRPGAITYTGQADSVVKVESLNEDGAIVQTPFVERAGRIVAAIPGKWANGPRMAVLVAEAAGIRPDMLRMKVGASLPLSEDVMALVAQPHTKARSLGPQLVTGDGMNVTVQPLTVERGLV